MAAMQSKDQKTTHEVLFVGTDTDRRRQFETECKTQIGRRHFVTTTEDAATLLKQRVIDLLVLDLESFTRPTHVRSLGELMGLRSGMETLALCPASAAAWLLDLMPHGLKHYCLSRTSRNQKGNTKPRSCARFLDVQPIYVPANVLGLTKRKFVTHWV